MSVKQLREKMLQRLSEARQLHDEMKKSGNIEAEQEASYKRAFDAYLETRSEVEREEQLQKEEQRLKETAPESRETVLNPDNSEERDDDSGMSEERQFKAVNDYMRGHISQESRDMQVSDDVKGGYIRTPPLVQRKIIKAVDNILFIRQKGTVIPLQGAEYIDTPSLETDVDDFEWTTEIGEVAEDSGPTFGRRPLYSYPVAKLVKISKKMLKPNVTLFSPVDLLIQRLKYKLGVTWEKNYMTGDGAAKPLGLFVASDQGIPTSRDVSEGNQATTPTFDGLKRAKYTMKQQYWPELEWIWHRDCSLKLALLKDGESRFIWQDSVIIGEQPQLMGFPVNMSEFAPNTFTANQYVGILGALSWYWMTDVGPLQIQHLVELYARNQQDGFITTYEGDGKPALAEAFARIKLGS
jgi:HK97 family phage major capsid protein